MTQQVSEITVSYVPRIKASERQQVKCSRDSERVFRQVFPDLDHREYFYLIVLNRSNKVLGVQQTSAGGISGTVTDIRLIFQTAILANASAIILAHNHPSGSLTPSDADRRITEALKNAGLILAISVLDHLIITTDSYYSFADEGLL